MKFRNKSQYDGKMLRRIVLATRSALSSAKMSDGRLQDFDVVVRTGQKLVRWSIKQDAHGWLMTVTVPRLNGAEFIALARQDHDRGSPPEREGLRSDTVALVTQMAIYSIEHWHRKRGSTHALVLGVKAELARRKVPTFVPIRVVEAKEDLPPRDRVQEKHDRLVELERRWQTKLKLAQTKLKKIRQKQKRYAKKLAERNAAQENTA